MLPNDTGKISNYVTIVDETGVNTILFVKSINYLEVACPYQAFVYA